MIRRALVALVVLLAMPSPAAFADEYDNMTILGLIVRYTAIVNELESRGVPIPGKPQDCPECEFTTVTARWSAPTEGSPVSYYVLQIETIATTTALEAVIPVPVIGDSTRARTGAVDALGRQGVWGEMGNWCPIPQRDLGGGKQ